MWKPQRMGTVLLAKIMPRTTIQFHRPSYDDEIA